MSSFFLNQRETEDDEKSDLLKNSKRVSAFSKPLMTWFTLLLVCGLWLRADSIFVCTEDEAVWGEEISPDTQSKLPLKTIKIIGNEPFLPPAGYIPIDKQEFNSLWNQRHKARPQNCFLRHAHYRAKLTSPHELQGDFSGEMVLSQAEPELFSLAPINFSLEQLNWGDQPAVWGMSSDNRLNVLVENSGNLTGKWSITGTALRNGTEYLLRFPPSATTQLEITLPNDLKLTTDSGTVKQTLIAEDDSTQWTIVLGDLSSCILTVNHTSNSEESSGIRSVQEVHNYLLEQNGLSLLSNFTVQLQGNQESELELLVPTDLNILNVKLKNDLELEWEYVSEENKNKKSQNRKIVVHLPAIPQGEIFPFQVETIGELKLNQLFELPELKLADLQESRISEKIISAKRLLKIKAPLLLQDYSAEGWDLTDIVSHSEFKQSEQRLRFQQSEPEGRFLLKLGFPESQASFNQICQLKPRGSEWLLETELIFQVQRGAIYETTLSFPKNWTIDDITSLPGNPGTSSQPQWERLDTVSSSNQVKINFPEGVQPGKPRKLLISSRSLAIPADQRMPFPYFQSREIQLHSLLSFLPTSLYYPEAENNLKEPMRVILESEIPDELADSFLVNDSDTWNNDHTCLHGVLPRNLAGLVISYPEQNLDVRAVISVKIEEKETTESVEIKFIPQDTSISRFYLYTNSSFGLETPFLVDQNDVDITFRREPENLNQNPAWDLPVDGELWVIRLDRPQSTPFTFKLERKHDTNLFIEQNLPLLFIPGTSRFTGDYNIWQIKSLNLSLPEDDSQLLTRFSKQPNHEQTIDHLNYLGSFEYFSPEHELKLDTANSMAGRTLSSGCHLELLTQLNTLQNNSQQHVAQFKFRRSEGSQETVSIDWSKECHVEAIQVNSNPIIFKNSDQKINILESDSLETEVEIRFRTAAQLETDSLLESFLTNNYQFAIPQISLYVTDFSWKQFIPKSEKFVSTSDKLFPISLEERPKIGNRLFGPLARTAVHSSLQESNPIKNMFDLNSIPGEMIEFRAYSIPHSLTLQTRKQTKALYYSWFIWLLSFLPFLQYFDWSSPRHRYYIWLWWGPALLLTLSVPDYLTPLTGAHFIGGLCSLLVSFLWTRWKDSEISKQTKPDISLGSTKAFPLTSLLLGILIFSGVTTTAAQELSPETRSTEPIFDLNRPLRVYEITPQNEQSREILYVPEKSYSQLLKQKPPVETPQTHWLQNATYQFQVEKGIGITLKARFHMLVPKFEEELVLHLPFETDYPLGTCYVNGKEVAGVTRGMYIPLSADSLKAPVLAEKEETGADSNLPGEEPTEGSLTNYQKVIVELTLYPTWTEEEPAGTEIQMTLPQTTSSELILDFVELPRYIEVNGKQFQNDQNEENSSSKQFRTTLVGTADLHLRWSDEDLPSPPVVFPKQSECIAELHPSFLRLNYRLEYQWAPEVNPSDHRQQITWSVPAKLIRENILTRSNSFQPLDLEVFSTIDPENETRQEISFMLEASSVGKSVVEASFILPITSNVIQIPQLHNLGSYSTPPMLLGLSGPTGFQVSLVNTREVEESSGSDFSSRWLNNLRVSPEKTFQYRNSESSFHFRYLPPSENYQTTESHRFNLHDQEISWIFQAFVEKVAETSPSRVHRLVVPESLKITDVSINESGYDRLEHWSREGENLILFPTRTLENSHQIIINGTFPTTTETTTELPRVKFKDKEFAAEESRVTISYPEGLQVSCVDKDQQIVFDAPVQDGVNSERKVITAEEVPQKSVLNLSMKPQVTTTPLQIVTRFNVQPPNRYRVKSIITIPAESSLSSLKLELPVQYAVYQDQLKITGELGYRFNPAEPQEETILTLTLDQSIAQEQQVSLELTLPVPLESQWNFPLPVLLNTNTDNHFVVMESPAFSFPSLTGLTPVSSENFAPLPDENSKSTEESIAYRLSRGKEEVALSQIQDINQILYQQIDLTFLSLDKVQGKTEVICRNGIAQQIRFFWKKDFHLRSGTINNTPLQRFTESEDYLSFPVNTGRNYIVLHWEIPLQKGKSGFRAKMNGLPLVAEENNASTFLTSSSASSFFNVQSNALTPLTGFDSDMESMQKLLNLESQYAVNENRSRLHSLLAGKFVSLENRTKTQQEKKRWGAFLLKNQALLNNLKLQSQEILPNAQNYFRLPASNPTGDIKLGITRVDDTIELRFLGCLLVLILWWFARKIPNLFSLKIPAVSVPFVLCLVGAVWALFLVQPIIGLVICFVSTIWGTIQILKDPRIGNRPEDIPKS